MSGRLKALSKGKAEFILTLARRIVPEVSGLNDQEQAELVQVIDDALSIRPNALRTQFNLFLDMIRWSTMLRHGKPLDKCRHEVQDEVLRKFEDAPIARMRTGMWGLKTLIFMGYYGKHERAGQFRYAPSFDGNEKLHGR